MPMALQCAFRQADRFANQAIMQADSDGVAKLAITHRAASQHGETLEPQLNVRLTYHVPKRRSKHQLGSAHG